MLEFVPSAEDLKRRIEDALPGSRAAVEDLTGGGDHFHVTVRDAQFTGRSLVDQHKMVYEALADPLGDGTIHELRITTKGTE